MPAPVSLREMRRQSVGPAVRLLEQVHRRRDLKGVGAAFAVALPFVADLLLAMLVGEVLGPEAVHARGGEQQRVFDPRPHPPKPLAREALEEILLLLVGRRHQQTLEK